MTPYRKAGIMNWLLTISFGFYLTVLAMTQPFWNRIETETDGDKTIVLLAALIPYVVVAWLAFRWPRCPSCREPTHTPVQWEGGGNLAFLARPRKRSLECGYCGQPLS